MTPFPQRGALRRALPTLLLAALAVACSDGPTEPEEPRPTNVSVSPSSIGFSALGDTASVAATVVDQAGDIMPDVQITWSSSAPDVASVSSAGLVTAEGNGSATITARAGEIGAEVSVQVQQVADRIRFEPDPVTLPEVGDTVTIEPTIVDANGNPMPLEPITWSSSDPQSVEVSAEGLATAVAEGNATIRATAGGVSGALAAFVGNATVVVGSVSPSPLVEGATAVVQGLGFSTTPSENEVLLDGFPATVTFASSVELRVTVPGRDCSPPGGATLRVSAFGMSDSADVSVRPAILSDPVVGEVVWSDGDCIHLASGLGSEQYVVGILSTSQAPSSLTPTRLSARAGSSLLASPARVTAGASPDGSSTGSFRLPVSEPTATSGAEPAGAPALAELWSEVLSGGPGRTGEWQVREADRRLLERLGPPVATEGGSEGTTGPLGAPLQVVPSQGDTLDFTVPAVGSDQLCSSGTAVRAVVRYVGDAAVFVEDVDNPTDGFTEAEFQALDGGLDTYTLPTVTSYFGALSDRDENGGRIVVLITKEVNEVENLAGFVFSGDLFPESQCAASDEAEIFYGFAPDPNGVHGSNPRTVEDVLAQYPTLIAHELTHILQFVNLTTTQKASWEFEGPATLAEQLVGFRVLGDSPRQNLGATAWREDGTGWYRDWVVDMALYFGLQSVNGSFVHLADAPEQCSWIGREDEGNTGPCEVSRAVYGVPATLFRYVLDEYGPSYPGGESALMLDLTTSPAHDLNVFDAVLGVDPTELLVRFSTLMYADGGFCNAQEGDTAVADVLLSWDMCSIFGSLVEEARLQPYQSTAAEPSLDVSVRAASQAYLEWSPPLAHPATSLRIRTPGGDLLPEHMLLWVLRVR